MTAEYLSLSRRSEAAKRTGEPAPHGDPTL